MRIWEAMVFLSLATGVHAGAWMIARDEMSGQSGGADGQSTITLEAASAQYAALASAWQQPPATALEPAALATPAAMTAPGPAPSVAPAAPRLAAPEKPAVPQLSALPHIPAPPRAPVGQPQTEAEVLRAPETTVAPPPVRSAEAPPVRPTAAPLHRPELVQPPKIAEQSATPRPAAPAQPKTRAAGAAAPKAPLVAGTKGTDATPTQTSSRAPALQAKWGARIQRKVHRHLVYPRGASGEGLARVALTVDRNGRLTGLQLVRSSGVREFDDAALKAVQRAGRFAKAPAELTEASYRFTLALRFQR